MYLQKQNIKKTNFPESYKKLKQLFDSKRIEEFIKEVQLAKQQDQNFPPEIVKISQDFNQILDKNERAMQILNSPKTNWKVNKINDLSQLAVRVNGTNIEFRYQGILSTNIENLAIMVYQLDLFKQWVPFCTKSQDLGQVSPLEKLAYLQVKMPLLADRYAYIYGIGIDRIQTNGSIIIYGEGITENEELLKKFNIQFDKKKYEKMTVMDLKFFICEISYKGQNQFIFKCYTEMDSRMPYIPEWLMNLVLKQLGGFIFDKVVKLSTNFKGTIWEKKMKEDRKTNPFYDWLHNRMESWHQMNKNPQKKNGLKNSKI